MMLLKEFQSEKFEKEKADQVRIEQEERKVISIKKEEPPKKEPETIKAEPQKLSGPSVVGSIDLSPKKKEVPKPELKEEPVAEKEPAKKEIKPELKEETSSDKIIETE